MFDLNYALDINLVKIEIIIVLYFPEFWDQSPRFKTPALPPFFVCGPASHMTQPHTFCAQPAHMCC